MLREIVYWLAKSTINLFKLIGLGIVFLLTYILWSITFPSVPKLERAKELLQVISHNNVRIPDSHSLIYSKHYQNWFSYNVCFVFSYPEGHYDISQVKFNYLNPNQSYEDEDFILDLDEYIPKSQGCNKFISRLNDSEAKLFMEYDYNYKGFGSGKGLKIFVNNKENLVMFEGFLYD